MACNQTLHNLTKECEDKQVMGGLKTELYITLRENVDFENIEETDGVISALPLISGKKWYKYQFDKNTSNITSTMNYDGVSGEKSFMTNNLSLVFRRMDARKRLAIVSLLNSEVVVVFTDNDGTTYFMGMEEYVSSTSAEFTSGTAKTDSNQTTIVLTDNTSDFMLLVADSVLDTIKTNIAE